MVIFCTRCWTQTPQGATTCRNCGSALEPLKGDYLEKLASALHHPVPDVAQSAAWVLGELGARQAVPALLGVLSQSSDPGALEAAVEALGKIGDSAALGTVGERWRRWPVRVRVKLAEALGRTGGQEAVQALHQLLGDPSSRVRAAARAWLETLRSRKQGDAR